MSKTRTGSTRDDATAARHEDAPEAEVTATVTWDDSAMLTSYANVINVINTREEFSLFFGQNQTWDVAPGRELSVKLGNRIVMTPYAVKRLHTLIGERLAAYEQRFGTLNVTG